MKRLLKLTLLIPLMALLIIPAKAFYFSESSGGNSITVVTGSCSAGFAVAENGFGKYSLTDEESSDFIAYPYADIDISEASINKDITKIIRSTGTGDLIFKAEYCIKKGEAELPKVVRIRPIADKEDPEAKLNWESVNSDEFKEVWKNETVGTEAPFCYAIFDKETETLSCYGILKSDSLDLGRIRVRFSGKEDYDINDSTNIKDAEFGINAKLTVCQNSDEAIKDVFTLDEYNMFFEENGYLWKFINEDK